MNLGKIKMRLHCLSMEYTFSGGYAKNLNLVCTSGRNAVSLRRTSGWPASEADLSACFNKCDDSLSMASRALVGGVLSPSAVIQTAIIMLTFTEGMRICIEIGS